jgi:chorismate dehydratase
MKTEELIVKTKIAAVSYLNAKPLTYTFESGDLKDLIELDFFYPSEVASRLIENKADVALLPVEALLSLKEYYIISDYCISTEGEVASVCLFSDVPLEKIKTVLLDYQSRTSVALLKILLRDYWKISPELINASEGYESKITDTTAGLVIGDRALKQRKKSKYIYDLGMAWKELTGKPFVFAVWAANKKNDKGFIELFNRANKEGINNIEKISSEIFFPEYNLHQYFTQNINYELDERKRESITFFLNRVKEYNLFT